MPHASRPRTLLAFLLVAVAFLSSVIAFLIVLRRDGPAELVATHGAFALRNGDARSTAPRGKKWARAAGFRDTVPKNGIDFRMSFLPSEQGETFKINLYDHGCGLAVADYDGDGHDDVLFLNQLGPNALYRNLGDGTFKNTTDEAGPLALADRIKVGAAFGDYDNDDDQDLYITSTRGGNVLFENLGEGQFRDVTHEAGVALVAHSQTPAFFDYDNDGDLDLFVTNTAKWTSDEFEENTKHFVGPSMLWQYVTSDEDLEHNVLFRNNGDGSFTNVTEAAGVAGRGWGGDVAAFDYDEDGDLDLLVTNMLGMSQLLQNDGHAHYDDVTVETLRRTTYGAIGVKAFDYDDDGRLDLFMADMHSDMWMPGFERIKIDPNSKYRHRYGPRWDVDPGVRAWEKDEMERFGLNYEELRFGNSLFRNGGAGRFTEVSDVAGMETFWPWGVAVGDFDNDRHEDAFLPSGMGYPFFYWPSNLMMNNGEGTFSDRVTEEGIEPPAEGQYLPEWIGGQQAARSSRCAATADFDGDGRLELIVNNFNDRPYCFQNQFPRRHYVAFRLRGTKSNHDAIGAVVKLFMGSRVMVRQVHCSGGYLSQSSKTLHFGLGDDQRIDRVEIRWPSGTRQIVEAPLVDVRHEIIEPEFAADGQLQPAAQPPTVAPGADLLGARKSMPP